MSNPLEWFGDRIREEAKKRMVLLMQKWGPEVVARAVQLCPKDSGDLARSIGWTMRQSDLTLQIHADAHYAMFVEYGTVFMPAQPFLRPAINIIRGFGTGGIGTEMQFQTRNFVHPQFHFKPRHDAANQRINKGLARTRGGTSKVHVRRNHTDRSRLSGLG